MASTKIEVRDFPPSLPSLIRLGTAEQAGRVPAAGLIYRDTSSAWFQMNSETFEVRTSDVDQLIGDVILVNPHRGTAERIIRQQSAHNTLLVTERCDQLCVMCSQPPKEYELDLFEVYEAALEHAPQDAVIGISGGEPLLYKERVFSLIEQAAIRRPDLGFHILTNAQHLEDSDMAKLRSLPHERLRFAVPLYASDSQVHDEIVGKQGAFDRLLSGISTLMAAGAEIEIRTVIMRSNAGLLADLAHFLSWNMPDIDHWAIMQMEYIGFAKKNWASLFFDHSVNAAPLRDAIAIAEQHGITCRLYNTPLCTLPEDLRTRAPRTISDWKQSYFPQCGTCSKKQDCSGVFAWAKPEHSFSIMEPL
ncbi:His-Xaa-Ser system radical SAM maturase HxsC [Falsirhodobacter sp. 1013]|uniref:His-Xaa-Ser system radical SAM maturase HxsC n=1 Tax=Falsirhodobacter sp. 1013 TaxID=3417566 RepID=UPI003EBD54C0